MESKPMEGGSILQEREDETWEQLELCKTIHYYCPVHGKCPGILRWTSPDGEEVVDRIGTEPLFFCEQCGKVKLVDLWNNTHDIATARRNGTE